MTTITIQIPIVLALLFVILCGVCIHRLVFHPLAKYPGPFLAKLTDLYATYHALRGDLHLDMHASHMKYGDIVRYGPNRILVNTNVGLHDILGPKKNVKKSKGYLAILPAPGAWSVHTAIDKAMHRRKRNVISQGLSDNALKAFEPLFMNHLEKFCSFLIEHNETLDVTGWSSAKNMSDLCNWLTFDVMGEFGFGKSFGMLDRPDNRFLIDAIAASNIRTSVYVQCPGLSKLNLEKIFYPRGNKMRARFLDVTRELAEARMAEKRQGKSDLFSFILDAKDLETGTQMPLAELWSESKFLIVAGQSLEQTFHSFIAAEEEANFNYLGSDTSSTVLASLFFYLTHNPTVCELLTSEILKTFSNSTEIVLGPSLDSCKYLYACIDEAMRISPPAGGAMWREVERGGAMIDGVYVAAGFDVGTSMYAIHHNEAYYPDPFTFKPERWIVSETNSAEQVQLARSALNAFSLGPRGCVGRGMALMEIRVALARVIWEFEIRLAVGDLGRVGEGGPGMGKGRERIGEYQLVDHLTAQKDGPWIEFRRRRRF